MSEVLTITDAASVQIKAMMKEHDEQEAMLRIGVKGGGCSGLSYSMGFEHEVQEADVELQLQGLHIVMDKESVGIMKGTIIDYKQSLLGGGFVIDNPNAIASCGCGSSFRTATNEGKPEEC